MGRWLSRTRNPETAESISKSCFDSARTTIDATACRGLPAFSIAVLCCSYFRRYASAKPLELSLSSAMACLTTWLISFVHERDPRTGKSQLPWFDYIFYQRGTRLANFYVRGMSLSAPSWSIIDTGQHLADQRQRGV